MNIPTNNLSTYMDECDDVSSNIHGWIGVTIDQGLLVKACTLPKEHNVEPTAWCSLFQSYLNASCMKGYQDEQRTNRSI